MRNRLVTRVTALAAVSVAATLLFANVAAALPAVPGSHGAAPAVGVAPVAGPPVVPNITPCPSPPIIDRNSGPALPDSGNPCPKPPPDPPPPPPAITCGLSIGDPRKVTIQGHVRVGVTGGIDCFGGTPQSISVLVYLYKQGDPDPVGASLLWAPSVRSLFTSAVKVTEPYCQSGNYYGWVKAAVTRPSGYSPRTVEYGPFTGAVEPITC
jgi:hypothetical protein